MDVLSTQIAKDGVVMWVNPSQGLHTLRNRCSNYSLHIICRITLYMLSIEHVSVLRRI